MMLRRNRRTLAKIWTVIETEMIIDVGIGLQCPKFQTPVNDFKLFYILRFTRKPVTFFIMSDYC